MSNKKRGTCPICNRACVIRKDGTLYTHKKNRRTIATKSPWCEGSNGKPK